MTETTITLSERELWLINWITKYRHDLWDMSTEEILTRVMQEWIKYQFDQYQELRSEAKKAREEKEC